MQSVAKKQSVAKNFERLRLNDEPILKQSLTSRHYTTLVVCSLARRASRPGSNTASLEAQRPELVEVHGLQTTGCLTFYLLNLIFVEPKTFG
jgi:hypothetical protein